jgi:hypothetical protein
MLTSTSTLTPINPTMKRSFSLLLAALCGLASATTLRAQSTAFSYQGRLNHNSAPATGLFDLRFTLFGEATNGAPVSSRITHSAVGVTNGLFTVLLDFSSDPFTGPARWLDIEARPAGGATFTVLTPRQPVSATPYAVTALNALTAKQVAGVSGNALHAADGSPQNAVFVNNDGNVGVGTTNPQERFDLRSGDGSYLRVDLENGDIKANGGSDGHWGVFNDGPSTGGTHLIGEGQTRLFVGNSGNVGVGTTTPQARLDVRGDVRLGPNGEFQATGGTENLRIVRGAVTATGSVVAGSGFSVGVSQVSDTLYTLIFDPPFSGMPSVTATAERMPGVLLWAGLEGVNPGAANVVLYDPNRPGFSVEGPFHFIAIGPR